MTHAGRPVRHVSNPLTIPKHPSREMPAKLLYRDAQGQVPQRTPTS